MKNQTIVAEKIKKVNSKKQNEKLVEVNKAKTEINNQTDQKKNHKITKINSAKKEIKIIVNPLKKGNFVDNLKQHIGNNCFDEILKLVKAKDQDITKLDYDQLIMFANYITIESEFDSITNENVATLVDLPENPNLEICLDWYRKSFPEGFIIVSDLIDGVIVNLMYQIDTLKMTYVWKTLIDEISLIASEGKEEVNYGIGLLMSYDKSVRYEYRDGFFLYNPTPYFDMEWDECLVDLMINAAESFTRHMGSYIMCDKFTNIMRKLLLNRLNTKDIYKQTRKVSRKHGIKI
ncbi:hypothetical protein MTBBW1_2500018 [Desulfamplus magnetovallimortis]|uniref:Uncharacterized protein n=1 Tax=Desulfamplus magnetovallimortis TaxID=1246637 RepID=A0A1W1HEF5_9BACT|nr:hypothetical protein [Desulfamplus magnetovallimortis]SLM30869.1 hypothetical protein MTBBW1_2500018 [Desulfamplus magnetovallimortis]